MQHSFNQGPSICLQIECKGSILSKVTLAKSLHFACLISKECNLDTAQTMIKWLTQYSYRKNPSPLSLNLPKFSPFYQKVLIHLQNLPFAQLVTYGNLASTIGHPKAARAVGSACKNNPFPLFIPCHRVVAVHNIGGFAYDLSIKQALLQFEMDLFL
ncbi:MAG: MGMT family protein [Chlamydiales bacterium]|jgi:methylated-DNA-[protein]-cysteine S-methyltransferase|nr:MGMT family protein [Chlamydiales bacterium]